MAVKITKVNYATTDGVVQFPEHCLALGVTFEKDDPNAVEENGKKYVKAGTIVEKTDSNGETFLGVVRYTVDVTDGDQMGALVVHGWIRTNKMPTAPTADQRAKMPMIMFV